MKTDMNGIVSPIIKDELKDLLKETKETLATDVKSSKNKPGFGPIDLWRMQKKHKTLGSSVRW